MDNDVRNSLEAIANLIYLIRKSLHDPAATIAYADLADAFATPSPSSRQYSLDRACSHRAERHRQKLDSVQFIEATNETYRSLLRKLSSRVNTCAACLNSYRRKQNLLLANGDNNRK